MKWPQEFPPLPRWSVVTPKRRAHIVRVTRLICRWADALELSQRERDAWRDAALWHDALRDANPARLGRPREDKTLPKGAWHGPASARRLRKQGEKRKDVLEAITWHTVGNAQWSPVGRALFCADFLEPGRRFARTRRWMLAARFPHDAEGVLREVVKMRLAKALDQGDAIHARMIELWESVR